MKIIVTGSRDWGRPEAVHCALTAFYMAPRGAELFEVIHGACPTGADALAEDWVQHTGWATSWDYPADWYGPCQPDCYHKPRKPGAKCVAAGPRRNQKMVDENLDAGCVLGFPLGESRGTRGCMAYADSRGLKVINLGER